MSATTQLVVYGDFNCPFSALASHRAERLERTGRFSVDWRAVEHEPSIPPTGQPVQGKLADELDGELEQVRGLLVAGEEFSLRRPPVRSNTAAATTTYAGVEPTRRPAVRAELFRWYWTEGGDLADGQHLREIADGQDPATAARWQGEWLQLEQRIVPIMRLPDGYVSRGLGALRRMAEFMAGA
ncbi:MAG: DsbA family protein [Acidimicrobiia bacterium]